jgi:hypothetical protein
MKRYVRKFRLFNFTRSILPSVIIVSCTTTNSDKSGDKPDSAWKELKSAQEVKCSEWPMAEKDLAISEVMMAQGAAGGEFGVVGQVKQRNASVQTVYMPYGTDEGLDTGKAVILPLAQTSLPLGLLRTDGSPALVVGHIKGGRSTFDLRDVRDNKVLAKASFYLEGEVSSAEISFVNKAYWLTLHFGDYETQYIRIQQGKTWTLEKGKFSSQMHYAKVVNGRGHFNLVEASAQESKLQVTLKEISESGLATNKASRSPAEIALQSTVESLAIAGTARGIHLVGVIGDSMVGQGEIINIDIKDTGDDLVVKGPKATKFPDLHLGEPVATGSPHLAVASVTKWLDGDANVAFVQLSDMPVFSKDFGPFARGSVVMELAGLDQTKMAALIRTKQKDNWIFKVCTIDPKF